MTFLSLLLLKPPATWPKGFYLDTKYPTLYGFTLSLGTDREEMSKSIHIWECLETAARSDCSAFRELSLCQEDKNGQFLKELSREVQQ